MSRARFARRPAAALVLAAACWGAGTVLSKQAVAEIPPLTLLPVQLGVSVVLLGLVAWRRAERLPRDRIGRRVGALGLLNPGLAYALSLLGLAQITASLSVLLWTLEPVLILLLAAVLLHERVGPTLVALSGVALGGLFLVLHEPGASGALPGVALTGAGVACCAVYTVATRRWLPEVASTLGVVVLQQGWALGLAIVLLAGSAIAGLPVVPATVSPLGAASAVVSGLVYYGLAYWLYLGALRAVPASVAAVSFYLVPVFGVALAVLAGERLELLQVAGAAIVVSAVAAITVRGAAGPASAGSPAPARTQ